MAGGHSGDFNNGASVDQIKNIIRVALNSKAVRVVMQEGLAPELTTAAASGPLPGTPPLPKGLLATSFGFLFPNDKDAIAARRPVRGQLNIPGVGRLQLIAITADPPSLRMYFPPQGDGVCDVDWTKLNSATVIKTNLGLAPMDASQATPPAPPAPHVTIAPVPAIPVAGKTTPPAPPAIDNTPYIGEPGAGLPFEAFGITEKIRKDSGAPSKEKNSGESSAAIIAAAPAQDSRIAATPVIPQPALPPMYQQAASAPVEEAEEEIYFEASRPGEASFSSGRNPIDALLTKMVESRASDMHLTGGEPVCFRIDGDIVRIESPPLAPRYMQELLLPIIPERNRREFVKINDTDFAYEVENIGRFRVNIFRDKNGVGAVLRHIPSKILTAEQLKLSTAIMNFCKLNKGLVVVTGPTGSGKSTTLAAMLDHINKTREEHLLTVEDPIEFVHPQIKCLVNQREVHRHTTSFARSLKAALREDPDIVLIGEMRDLETIAIAIETAETGHLVFGTLHTTTAISTVDRIIDQFPADRQEQIRTMLSSSLRGVVAQTLVKKKGGGRVAAHEILVVNDAVSALIREGKTHMLGNHMQTQKVEGNQLLNEALMKLVTDNLIEPADAFMKAVDKNSLLEIMRRKGINTTSFETKKSA